MRFYIRNAPFPANKKVPDVSGTRFYTGNISPVHMERITRLELATSTLARWRSTR